MDSPDNQTAPEHRRSFFLPGFVLGFLILAVLSCSGALFAAGIDAGKITQLRDNSLVAWTAPPTPVPSQVEVAPQRSESESTVDDAYLPGDRPRNITSSLVNIRSSPGYLGKPAQDVVAQAVPGQEVEILGGPETVDGLEWWRVRLATTEATVEGWIAEATASGVQILGN